MDEYKFVAKEYHKKIHPQTHGVSLAVLIFLIIILIGAAFLFMPKPKKNYLYFVEVNEFLTFADANILANDIMTRNGAGFIFFDGSYRVFANIYLTQADAESVVENLKAEYATAKVFKLEYKKFSTNKKLTDAQNSATKNLTESALTTISNIYNNILSFDKNEITEAQLKTNFLSILHGFEPVYNDFMGAFNSNSKYLKAKNYCAEMNSSLEKLAAVTSNENYISKMKYEAINFSIYFYNILNSF